MKTFETNKIDISANIVRIPLAELKEVATIAVGKSKHRVEQHLNEIQHAFCTATPDLFAIQYMAERLAENSAALEKSIKVLHALTTSESRDQLEILK